MFADGGCEVDGRGESAGGNFKSPKSGSSGQLPELVDLYSFHFWDISLPLLQCKHSFVCLQDSVSFQDSNRQSCAMGVRGLNTLVNQIRGSVSKTHVLPIQGSSTHPPASANHVAPNDSSTASSSTPVPPPRRCVVVDFWAFVFWTSEILDARLAKQTWIQGGYYAEHEALVKEIISLWL